MQSDIDYLRAYLRPGYGRDVPVSEVIGYALNIVRTRTEWESAKLRENRTISDETKRKTDPLLKKYGYDVDSLRV